MPRGLCRTLTLAGCALALVSGSVRAQLVIDMSFGVGFASAYVDRGVILTSEPVLQPNLTIALPLGGGSFGFGIGATVEPVSLDTSRYFSMAPGGKSPNVVEARPSLMLSQLYGPVRFAFGAVGRIYPNSTGLTKAANTVSFQSTVGLPRVPFSPSLTFSYDVGGINGSYFEGEVRQLLPIASGVGFSVSGRVGYSLKQTADTAVVGFVPYTRDGFTHLEVSAGPMLRVAGAMLNPYLAFTYVPNPIVAASGLSRQREHMLRVGTILSLAGRFPKAAPVANAAPAVAPVSGSSGRSTAPPPQPGKP